MLLRLSAAALALAATPAFALSCLPPDPVQAFSSANAAPEIYWVVRGTFTGGPGPRPKSMGAEDRVYEAGFAGHVVTRDGLAQPLTIPVAVHEQCLASWCPELATGREVLTFLQVGDDGAASLTFNACGGNLFYDPDEAVMQAIRDCFVAGCTEG